MNSTTGSLKNSTSRKPTPSPPRLTQSQGSPLRRSAQADLKVNGKSPMIQIEKERGAAIQKETVESLQKQIHILELESRYLRGRATKPDNGEESADPDISSIGKHMTVLRKKCITLEKQHKEQISILESEREELQKRTAYLEHIVEVEKADIVKVQQTLEKLGSDNQIEREKFINQAVMHQRLIEKQARMIARLEQEKEKYNNDREELLSKTVALELDLQKEKAYADAARGAENAALKREETSSKFQSEWERRADESATLQTQLREATQNAKIQIQKLTEEKWSMELQLKQAQSSLEQVQISKDKYERDCADLMRELSAAKTDRDNYKRNVEEFRLQLKQKEEEMGAKHEKAEQTTSKSSQLYQKWKEAEQRAFSSTERATQAQNEILALSQNKASLLATIERMKTDQQEQEAYWTEVDKENGQLRQENSILTDLKTRLTRELMVAKEENNSLKDQLAIVSSEHSLFSNRLSQLREINKNLNQDELQDLKATNLQVAETVSKLTQRLSILQDDDVSLKLSVTRPPSRSNSSSRPSSRLLATPRGLTDSLLNHNGNDILSRTDFDFRSSPSLVAPESPPITPSE